MQQTNDLFSSGLAGGQHEDTPLATYLSGLHSLELSEKGRLNTCNRFRIDEAVLDAALAACAAAKRRVSMPVPAKEFGAEALACAMTLTGASTPTAEQLDTALLEMYPAGGPTAASLVAAGWLVPTIDKQGLRYPPLTVGEDKERPDRLASVQHFSQLSNGGH